MRFIAGPRQCGKTTIAKSWLQENQLHRHYYNWDFRETRTNYQKNADWFAESIVNRTPECWVIFDEIHKYPQWKNILKEVYDKHADWLRLVVTGSARLDMFRKSGDSLAGRYFLFNLYPIALHELTGSRCPLDDDLTAADNFIQRRLSRTEEAQQHLEQLLVFSGFPDPLLSGKTIFHKKWQTTYIDKIINEDISSIAHVKDLENISRLLLLLPQRIGSPLSVNSLLEDLLVSYNAVSNYLHLLDMSYVTFTISPYSTKITRSIKKEKKLYLYDWTCIPEESYRFENYVAVELKSTISLWNDLGNQFELYYLRTREGKESDFMITKDQRPWLIIEVKSSKQKIESHHYKSAVLLGNIPVIQLIRQAGVAEKYDNAYQVSAARFF